MDQVLEKGTAGPIEQEAVDPYAHMHGHESDVDDSSEKEEMERPVKKRKGPSGQKACREQGCDKWALAGRLCWKYGGGSQKPCSVEGCGTLAKSKGLCWKHGGKR